MHLPHPTQPLIPNSIEVQSEEESKPVIPEAQEVLQEGPAHQLEA